MISIKDIFSSRKNKSVVKSDPLTGSVLVNGQFIPLDLFKLLKVSTPTWSDLSNLYNIYINNPILYAALSINARYFASVDVRVRDIKTGEIYSKQNLREGKLKSPVAQKMFNLISEPNPLQSTAEFLTFQSITYDLFGNSFIKGNFAFDIPDINNVSTLIGLLPQHVKPELTGKYLNQTEIKNIIKSWKYTLQAENEITLNTDTVLHRKESNLSFNKPEDLVMGISRVFTLQKPLSNITMAYEARNILAKERGMRVIISSDLKDGMGSAPMMPQEKKDLERSLQHEHGLLEGQNQFKISEIPIKVTQIDQDIRKLGILDEIAIDAHIVSNVYGIPNELIKLYMAGATYENMGSSERIMYQSNSQPRANDFFEDLNNFLNVRKYGFEYYPYWGDIAVLQEDKKERSLVRRNESFVCRESFLAGQITGNEWRQMIGLEKLTNAWFDKYIWEMTPEQQTVISGRNQMLAQNENKPAVDSSSQI